MIPEVPREKLLEALAEFDRSHRNTPRWDGWESHPSFKFAIEYEGRRYPPKQIIRMATGFSDFSGGPEANGYLGRAGFNVVPLRTSQEGSVAMSDLRESLEQILSDYARARTEKFGKDHPVWNVFARVERLLEGCDPVRRRPNLTVTWSVGMGNWTRVPWIAFLDKTETTTTQRGVYCVLLFRTDLSGVYLTLNQGVTEPINQLGARRGKQLLRDRAVQLREHCTDLATEGFSVDDKIDLRTTPGIGANYEVSTVAYKLYEAGDIPEDDELETDLEAVLGAYDAYLDARGRNSETSPTIEAPRAVDLSAVVEEFSNALRVAHVTFGSRHTELVRAFVASLATKRLVILTGLSGSGKTQIAMRFGEFLGNRYRIEPVRPDWTGAEALFGYEDALRPGLWQVPLALEFMLAANANPHNPYLLILDEMNLAHVERYFADVLSGIESDHPVLPNLSRDPEGSWRIAEGAEPRVPVPRNLFIVGTVNVDETTYMFSPKVLDRSNVFEFRVNIDDLQADYRKPVACDEGYPETVRTFLAVATNDTWHLDNPAPALAEFSDRLRSIHSVLAAGGAEFGHRVFYEAIRFAAILAAAGERDPIKALDLQIMQKILPRLHGARRRLEPILCGLGRFAYDLIASAEIVAGRETFDPLGPLEGAPRLRTSFDKIQRMLRAARTNQFASFTE